MLVRQDEASVGMAAWLESLVAHYEHLAMALREKEAGTELEDADMEGASCAGACEWHRRADVCMRAAVFVWDTAELPAVVAELEEAVVRIGCVACMAFRLSLWGA